MVNLALHTLIIYSNLTMNIGRRVKPSSSSRDRTAKLQTTRTISTETRTSSSTPRCRCATRMPTQHQSRSPSASSGQQASQRHCRSIFYQNVKFDLFRVYEQFEIPDTSKNIQRYTLKWLEGFKRENVNPSDQVMIIFFGS